MGNRKKKVALVRANSTIKQKPIWRFDLIDRSGKFAFDLSRKDFKHREVLHKLIEYGGMTWDEISRQQHDWSRKSKHHYLKFESLSSEAIACIKARHLDEEIDSIYSFSFQNLLRIIGIRQGPEFFIIWYDPKHEFCPSTR